MAESQQHRLHVEGYKASGYIECCFSIFVRCLVISEYATELAQEKGLFINYKEELEAFFNSLIGLDNKEITKRCVRHEKKLVAGLVPLIVAYCDSFGEYGSYSEFQKLFKRLARFKPDVWKLERGNFHIVEIVKTTETSDLKIECLCVLDEYLYSTAGARIFLKEEFIEIGAMLVHVLDLAYGQFRLNGFVDREYLNA